ncbi:MAG: hypothetical protein FWD27_07615 [Coriobacteriia bacterium]|nr:hypothetical protein [Coriobacteriia bacterium]
MNKRMLTALLVCALMSHFFLIGCGGSSGQTIAESQTTSSSGAPSETLSEVVAGSFVTINRNSYSFLVDSSWIEERQEKVKWRYYPADVAGPALNIWQMSTNDGEAMVSSSAQREELDSLMNGLPYTFTNKEVGSFGSHALITADFEYSEDDDRALRGYTSLFFISSSNIVVVMAGSPADMYEDFKEVLRFTVDSFVPFEIPVDTAAQLPDAQSDSNFWSAVPTSNLNDTVADAIPYFENEGMVFLGIRLFMYHEERERWFEVTDFFDAADYSRLTVSQVSYDDSLRLLVQLTV